MASSKALLVILLIAVAYNANVINGTPGKINIGAISGLSITTTRDGIVVDSTEIHEQIGGMTSKASSMINDSWIAGDDNKRVFSDKSNSLVIIEKGKCTKYTYKNKVRVSTETMSSTDCDVTKAKIRKLVGGSGSSSTSSNDSNALAEFWEKFTAWMQSFQKGNSGKH